jgi:hypothetical protein
VRALPLPVFSETFDLHYTEICRYFSIMLEWERNER